MALRLNDFGCRVLQYGGVQDERDGRLANVQTIHTADGGEVARVPVGERLRCCRGRLRRFGTVLA